MDMVNVKVNGIAVSVPKGSTILEAARAAGVEIPTLCYLKEINEIGACRICVVEATGARGLVTACVYPVNEGMEITTNSEKVQKARRTTLELILSTHENCRSCAATTAWRIPANTTVSAPFTKRTKAPPIWCGTTTNVSCAAAAWRRAASSLCPSSAPTIAVSTPTSPVRLKSRWTTCPASPAASALWCAPPAP